MRTISPLRRLPQGRPSSWTPTWRDARPARIHAMLSDVLTRSGGGWVVASASTTVTATSIVRDLAGREVVLWRDAEGGVHAGPGACPHLGARLEGCATSEGDVLCRWHGMALPREAGRGWREFKAFDDGVLVWVQLLNDEEPMPQPVASPRPALTESVAAVIERTAKCEPRDIIANRLDPWHGSWFHPYAFSHLVVDEDASGPDRLVLDVAFRVAGPWAVPVRAEFTTPDARTITMRITEGEGAGSVVETHATPLTPTPDGRAQTLLTEATLAYSDRKGFAVVRALRPMIAPLIARTAGALWVDDLEYAERLYLLREGRR